MGGELGASALDVEIQRNKQINLKDMQVHLVKVKILYGQKKMVLKLELKQQNYLDLVLVYLLIIIIMKNLKIFMKIFGKKDLNLFVKYSYVK
ncbi:hypothetical protein [Defluviitalea phaphyphila]|uniref:hypothetical protein n=1 Tax=Defluviitalea phaphyphila TaxID=1473580 RepID=UPI000731321A|nr:hypothetical protein [Defluviitalea phaphyphila]